MRKMMNDCYAWKTLTTDLRRAADRDRIRYKAIRYGMTQGKSSESVQETDKVMTQIVKYRYCA